MIQGPVLIKLFTGIINSTVIASHFILASKHTRLQNYGINYCHKQHSDPGLVLTKLFTGIINSSA
jgi:hypothetical protein